MRRLRCISTSFLVLRAPESWLNSFFQPFSTFFVLKVRLELHWRWLRQFTSYSCYFSIGYKSQYYSINKLLRGLNANVRIHNCHILPMPIYLANSMPPTWNQPCFRKTWGTKKFCSRGNVEMVNHFKSNATTNLLEVKKHIFLVFNCVFQLLN